MLLVKKFSKGLSKITVSGITLSNHEIKDIIKEIRFLENRIIFLERNCWQNY